MDTIVASLHYYLGADLRASAFIIFNLIIIESLLSVDNAAVLAKLVMPLPAHQRNTALRIGILLAYIFRGTCLVFASVLIKISWLKLLGGLYLIYLFADFIYNKSKAGGEEEQKMPERKFTFLPPFISTVIMVEIMDLSFSIDNVFAAVAFTNNIVLVCIGVFIGIIMMRVVAGYFVLLMERFPFLDTVALIVIGLLGLKLCASFAAPYISSNMQAFIDRRETDLYFSFLTVSIFLLPVLGSLLLKFLKKHN